MHELIKNDLHNISNRLKLINPKYEVFRNIATHRFEVHNNPRTCARSLRTLHSFVHPNSVTLQFIVPYDELDERTLEYANKTRIENFDAIDAEHANTNAEIEKTAKRSIQQAAFVLGDMLRYAGNQIHEVVFKKIERWF